MTYTLGVDLGTTFTAAAVLRGGLASMVSLGVRQPEMPSIIAVGDTELFVGDAAEHHGRTSPESVARFFKRRFGDSTPLVVRGQPWSAEALSARLLGRVLEQVEQVEGSAPSGVVLTHPAGWREFKVDGMHSVAQLAGVNDYQLVAEPVAAARHYAELNRLPSEARLAVFDLGGGTFDTSVVATSGGTFSVVGTPRGVNRLGGIDLDEAVFAHVCLTVGVDPYELDDTPEVRRAIWRLRRECRDAKEMLSATSVATISVVLPGINTEVELGRATFEAMLAPVLNDAGQTVDGTIRSAGLTVDEIDAVLLVGGSSRIPAVRDFLSDRFGRPVLVDTHPKHAVPLGAARMWTDSPTGASAVPPAGQTPLPSTPAVPPPAGQQPPMPATPAPPAQPLAPQRPSSQRSSSQRPSSPPPIPATPDDVPQQPTPAPTPPTPAPLPQPVQASVPTPLRAATQLDGQAIGSRGAAPFATSGTSSVGGGASRKPFFAVLAGLAIVLVSGLGYVATRDDGGGGDVASPAPTTGVSTTAVPTTSVAQTEPPAEDQTTPPPETTEDPVDDSATPAEEPLGDGSLGTVVIAPGEAIQIRSIAAITGDVAFLGLPAEEAMRLAIDDYGTIRNFAVEPGTGLDDLCSFSGGEAAANTIVADPQIVGVVGTSCSGSAAAAVPVITEAGLVIISPTNTSPALTADLNGTAGVNYHDGYYRTAHNDLVQSQAMAIFVFNELGLTTAAAVHDGDPYTESLATAFADTFTSLGGTIVGVAELDPQTTDVRAGLADIATGEPAVVYLPVFQPLADFVADQLPSVAGLEEAVVVGSDAILVDSFLEQDFSEGIYISEPNLRFGTNKNQATDRSATEILEAYEASVGEPPTIGYWAHSYDATTLLLDAIAAASTMDGDSLVIDRAGMREYLNSVSGYSGVSGTLNCDAFGDCSADRIAILRHESSSDIPATRNNVVFEFQP